MLYGRNECHCSERPPLGCHHPRHELIEKHKQHLQIKITPIFTMCNYRGPAVLQLPRKRCPKYTPPEQRTGESKVSPVARQGAKGGLGRTLLGLLAWATALATAVFTPSCSAWLYILYVYKYAYAHAHIGVHSDSNWDWSPGVFLTVQIQGIPWACSERQCL